MENNDSLNMVYAVCPQCNAQLEVDPAQETAICRFCGAPFAADRAISAYMERYQAYVSGRLPTEPAPAKKKKRRTFLWVLGWVFCFPIPLTILMRRNQKLDRRLRYGIIAAAWILYLALGALRYRSVAAPENRSPTGSPTSMTEAAANPAKTPASIPPFPNETAVLPSGQPAAAEPDRTDPPQDTQELPGVSPEFKAAMDSYEDFFDEYVEFMQKFSENPSDLGLLMQYTEFMSQYTETMDSLNAIDESELTPEEDAYYLEVMTRINTKLLEAAQYMSQE